MCFEYIFSTVFFIYKRDHKQWLDSVEVGKMMERHYGEGSHYLVTGRPRQVKSPKEEGND